MNEESTTQSNGVPTILLVNMVVDKVNNVLAIPVHDSCDINTTRQKLKSSSPDDVRATLLNTVLSTHKGTIRPIVEEWRPWVHYRDRVDSELVYCKKDCKNCPVQKYLTETPIENAHCYCEV